MKTALATVLAAATLVIAGCGSGSKLGSGSRLGSLSFKAGTTTTVEGVETGTLIRCLGIENAPAPPAGTEATYSPDAPGSSGRIWLRHMKDGSLTVSCIR